MLVDTAPNSQSKQSRQLFAAIDCIYGIFRRLGLSYRVQPRKII